MANSLVYQLWLWSYRSLNWSSTEQYSCPRKQHLYYYVSQPWHAVALGVQTYLHVSELCRQGAEGDVARKCSSSQHESRHSSFYCLCCNTSMLPTFHCMCLPSDFTQWRFGLQLVLLPCSLAQTLSQTPSSSIIVCSRSWMIQQRPKRCRTF
jgi:hypothetical protein